MLTIDGSMGEGGGQILRTSLALSAITGTPIHLHSIRQGREKPGLMRQHLAAVLSAAKICGAEVEGAAINSREIRFKPGPVEPGQYTFSIGSAGSTTLVLQTVLPVLLTADGPSTLEIEGGTHNIHAPPADFLQQAFIPLVCRMGPTVDVQVERYGFYPAGGGRLRVTIEPAPLRPLQLIERGDIVRRLAKAVVSSLPRDIGDRELAVVRDKLNWPEESLCFRHLSSDHGPGNIITLEIESENVTEVFTGFGQRGVPAETVAGKAVDEARQYLKSGAAVGEHLVDQLLLPLALAGGGQFTASALSLHATTNITVIQYFLPVRFHCQRLDTDRWQVSVGSK